MSLWRIMFWWNTSDLFFVKFICYSQWRLVNHFVSIIFCTTRNFSHWSLENKLQWCLGICVDVEEVFWVSASLAAAHWPIKSSKGLLGVVIAIHIILTGLFFGKAFLTFTDVLKIAWSDFSLIINNTCKTFYSSCTAATPTLFCKY